MKPLAERLSKKQKRAALVALVAGCVLYIIFYPPDIPRPNTITFEGYAPPEAGILSATASAKAERDNYFCKRHFLGASSRPRDIDEHQFVKPGSDGYYKVVLNINNIPLGGLCRYKLYAARLGFRAKSPSPRNPSFQAGDLAASIEIPPQKGRLRSRASLPPFLQLKKGKSQPLQVCCDTTQGVVPSCQLGVRTIKSFDKDYTFRVDLEMNPKGCPPIIREEGSSW